MVTGGKGRRVKGSGEVGRESRSAEAAGMVVGMSVNQYNGQVCCVL